MMRLIKLTVENFRCYSERFTVKFDDLTALIGQNDVGKSALMDALAIFFDEAKLDKDDACKTGDAAHVRIICEFDELPDQVVVDNVFPTTLSAEYLLSSDGTLVIQKTYNGSLATPKITSTKAIADHPTAEGYDDLLTLKKAELAARARELNVDLNGVNRNINAPVRAAIRASTEEELNLASKHIPLDQEGARDVWRAILPHLPTFALFKSDRASTDQDAEAQDPLKAAIREAIKAVESKLLDVEEHVKSEVKKIGAATVEKLREMDPSIAETLDPVITTKKWESLFQTSITGDEGIPLNKRGSGVKRMVLLNFFRAKAEKDAESKNSSSVIYAVEEPETSQHPRNQRLLLSALRELASDHGRQVIATTHTPMLARYISDGSLRFLQRDAAGMRTIAIVSDETRADIAKSLGVLPDHNVKVFIGVEGPHDISFLKGISRVLLDAGEAVPDLDAFEMNGELIFFPFGGSNLALWASRLKDLNRPEYHICDRDTQPPDPPRYADYMENVNVRDRCTAVATGKREMENYLHHEAIVEAYAENGVHIELDAFGEFADVPMTVAMAVHAASGRNAWECLTDVKRVEKKKNAKRQLNGAAVQKMTAARLLASDPDGEVRGWLSAISQMIEDFD